MTEWVALFVAFALIVLMINRKFPLALAMLAGSAVLGLGLRLGPLRTLEVMARALVSPAALELALVVALITLLGRLMQEFSLLKQTIDSLTGLLRSTRLALVAAPSMVGLMPVLGGAIISAPMVDGLGDRLDLPAPVKAAVNLVFRHAWFFIFPFQPSLILAAQLTGMSVPGLVRLFWPLMVTTLIAGYLAYFRGRPREPAGDEGPGWRAHLLTFLAKGSPLLAGLVLAIGFGLPMAASVAVGVAVALLLGRRHPRFHPRLLWLGIDRWMVLTMPAIIVFREVVGEAGAIAVMVGTLVEAGLPLLGLAFALPFLIGFISASHSSTIGITFPLLLPLAEPSARPALVVLMFSASFVAYIVSPLHLCQILTLEYFKERLGPLYRQYLIPMTTVLLAAWVLAWVYWRQAGGL